MKFGLLPLPILALLLSAPLPLRAAPDAFVNPQLRASTSPLWNARLDGIDVDGGNLSVTDCPQGDSGGKAVCQGAAFNLKVDDAGLRTKALKFHLGDHIRIAFGADGKVTQIGGSSFATIGRWNRILILCASALILYAFTTLATSGKPLKLIVGLDNRYSNSKLQVAVWFWILISTYLATLYFRIASGGMDFLGNITIPQNLLLLSGLSAITFGGAKAITTAKVNAAANPVQQPGAVTAVVPDTDPKNAMPKNSESFVADLVQNDNGDFDFGDFQMVVVTLLAVCTYLLGTYHYLATINLTAATTLPDVDTTILATFGLGQGAYLAKKAAGNVGSS